MPQINDESSDAERRQNIIRAHVAQLAEHFDTVQVFCTFHTEEEGTCAHQLGSGNWYARFGYVKEWCIKQDETTRENLRREADE